MDAEQTAPRRVAILLVHGGANRAAANRWTRFCLEQLRACTDYPNYHIYFWNNDADDKMLPDWVGDWSALTLLTAASYEQLNHPHRTPLQRLYHLAQVEGAHYIVTLDNDAHPLRTGWLTQLVGALDDGAILAGAWRDEMAAQISPYIHPSCLCTTVDFVEGHQLRFDCDTVRIKKGADTVTHFTRVAEAEGAPIYPLLRSNHRNFHYLMGGVYGDMIYHHGAGGRAPIFHADLAKRRDPALNARWEDRRAALQENNRWQQDQAAALLFSVPDLYIGWLRGEDVPPAFAARMAALAENAAGVTPRWSLRRLLTVGRRLARGSLQKLPVLQRLIQRWRRARQAPRGSVSGVKALLEGPFTLANLAPVPRGWTTQPPDFVGVGAPHSGAAWWQAMILDHPQVTPDRVIRAEPRNTSELEYFVHFQPDALTAAQKACYRQAFAVPPGAICGEFSTLYLGHPGCIEQLAATVPAAKVLVILCNPIDRFLAHLNQLTSATTRAPKRCVQEPARSLPVTSSLRATAALHSLYGASLERLLQHFDRQQVLILQYARLIQEPAAELARTYRFLGADERYRPQKPIRQPPADLPDGGPITAARSRRLTALISPPALPQTCAAFWRSVPTWTLVCGPISPGKHGLRRDHELAHLCRAA